MKAPRLCSKITHKMADRSGFPSPLRCADANYLAPVVQKVDSVIHWIIYHPVNTQLVSVILIHWIAIYPVDSAIQLLNNQGMIF